VTTGCELAKPDQISLMPALIEIERKDEVEVR
jgi:hypothetical protein